MSVKGKGARDKGSRAERRVRDILKQIYPVERRRNVNRIPMSGAGYIKGDVSDGNDPDSCYEVKNHESVHLPEWWRQTKDQAGTVRTPVLVVTQNHRPFYFILRRSDWEGMVAVTEYREFTEESPVKSGAKFFDDMAELDARTWGSVTLDDDECVVISQTFYVEVKTSIFEATQL